jgi:type II secretory ATPase GspE/PulE/Tfp pilus assembly ATPase PilB-like protein
MQDPILTAGLAGDLPLLLADAPVLMSIAKPILVLAVFVVYMRLVAKFEADARNFTLPVVMWNAIYMSVAAAALAVVLLVPIFWVGWPLATLLLGGTVFAYVQYRNPRVPERVRFTLGGEGFAKAMEVRKQASANRAATVIFTRADGKSEPVPQKESPELGVYVALEQVLLAGMSARASRVDLVSAQGGVAASILVDGVRSKLDPMASDLGNAAIDMLKRMSGLDVNDRRRRQTGSCKVAGGAGGSKLTVTTSGSSQGQIVRVDFDREGRLGKDFETIGLAAPQLAALRSIEEPSKRVGVVLLSAPPGQGLTTLGYTMLSRHDAYTSNIKTLEREVQYTVEGVDHKAFQPEEGVEDFPAMLTKIIRRDPDVVLCGDLSEAGTGKAAALMGRNTPLVYVLVPAESMAQAVSTWMTAVGDPKKAAECLTAVVHQRLIRTLCPNCKAGFTPAPEQAKKLGIPAGKEVQLFRPSGKIQVKNRIEDCPVCQGGAYFGQTGFLEVLMLDDEARRLLAENDYRTAIARAVREQKMLQLQDAALLKVRSGETSLEEVQRVLAPRQAAQRPAAGAGA